MPDSPHSTADRQVLLEAARRSIASGLEQGEPLAVDAASHPSSLRELGACFVTLKIQGNLRGCIGTLEPHRPLVVDCAENAFAAAFRDTRFQPLTVGEYPQLEYHISILGPQTPLVFESEQELLGQLQPGVDGLVLEERGYRGIFLPAVWEQLPDERAFLRHLKRKAGLPELYWSDTLRVQRFHVESIGD